MKPFMVALVIAGLGIAVWLLLPPVIYRWSRPKEDLVVVPFEERGEIVKREVRLAGVPLRSSPFIDLVNRYRSGHGLPAIVVNGGLCRLARERLEEVKTDWSHDGFNNRNLYTYCPECTAIGENLARDFDNLENVILMWNRSPSHRKLLLSNYRFGCSAQATVNGMLMVVLELGR